MKYGYKLYNKDCFEVFEMIPDQSIDLVLTDPPYGTICCAWDSIIPLKPMWEELNRFVGCDNDKTHGYWKTAKERIRTAYKG